MDKPLLAREYDFFAERHDALLCGYFRQNNALPNVPMTTHMYNKYKPLSINEYADGNPYFCEGNTYYYIEE